jgi:hypothetical protein
MAASCQIRPTAFPTATTRRRRCARRRVTPWGIAGRVRENAAALQYNASQVKIRSSRLSSSGSSLLGQAPTVRTGATNTHPMAQLLFGKRPPKLVDRRKHPKVRKGLAHLDDMTEQVALLLGRRRSDFTLELCEGDNACISRDGQLAFGVELLEQYQDDDDLLLSILGHEIGHQPWDWPEGTIEHLSASELSHLYREEEAKADRFAGRVLAELGSSPDAVERFLRSSVKGFEAHQSKDYYPVEVRVEMIRKAFERRKRSMTQRAHLIGG